MRSNVNHLVFGGSGGFQVIGRSGLSGQDKPNDMAQAWLDGDLERYERLRAAHAVECAERRTESMRQIEGRPRTYDRVQVRRMVAVGMTLKEVSKEFGCSISTVWRILNEC